MLKDERRGNENGKGVLHVKRKYITRSSKLKNGWNWYTNTNDVFGNTNFKEYVSHEQRIEEVVSVSNTKLSGHCDPKNDIHPVTKIKSPVFKYSKCRTCRIPCSGEVFKIRKFNLNIEKIDSSKYNGKTFIKSVATTVQDKFVVRDNNLSYPSISIKGVIANNCNSNVLSNKEINTPNGCADSRPEERKLVNGIHDDFSRVAKLNGLDDNILSHNTFNSSDNASFYLNADDKSMKDTVGGSCDRHNPFLASRFDDSGNHEDNKFIDESAANLICKPVESRNLDKVALDLANGDVHEKNVVNQLQNGDLSLNDEDKDLKNAAGDSENGICDLRYDQFNSKNSIINDENVFSMVLRSQKSSINDSNVCEKNEEMIADFGKKLNCVLGSTGTMINSSEFDINNKKIHFVRNTSCSSGSFNTDESYETEVEDNISINDESLHVERGATFHYENENVSTMKHNNYVQENDEGTDVIKDANDATRTMESNSSDEYNENSVHFSCLKNARKIKCVSKIQCWYCGDNQLDHANCTTDLSRNLKLEQFREHNFIHNRKHVRLKHENQDYWKSSSFYLHDNESFSCYILESTRRLKFLHNSFYTSIVKHDEDIFEAMLDDIEVDIKIYNEDSKRLDKDGGVLVNDQEICITNEEHVYTFSKCEWEDCDEKFVDSMKLLDHLKTSHIDGTSNDTIFCCLWRKCKFSNQPSSYKWLSNHVLKHCSVRPFKCVIGGCELSFATQNGLARHVPSHFNEGKVRRTCVTTSVGKGQENGRRSKLDAIANSADNSEENDEVNEPVRKKTKFEKFVDRYKTSCSVDKSNKSLSCIKYKLHISTCNSTSNCGYIGKDFRFNHKVIGKRTSKDGSTDMLLTPSTDIFPYESFWLDEDTLVKQKSLHVDLSVNDLSNDVKQLIYDNELISRFKTRENRGV